MSLYKTGDSVAVHSVCGTLPRETIAIGVVAAAGSDLIELQDGQCVTDSNCIEPVTDEHQATIPTDSVQPTPDTCPPWRMHPNRKRPKPFLPYGFTSYDFDGFMAWIKQSFPSVYERMGKCENNSSGIERLLGVLIEELRTADSSKCLQSLRIIHECVTAIHPDLFNNLATELQGSVLIAVADCLQNDDRIVRRQAVGTLALFLPVWDREVLNALIGNGITNEDSETAVHSIELLHGIESNLRSLAVPALTTALSNSNDEVCRIACCALEDLGNDALHSENALIQIVLSNRNDATRFAALRVLLAVAGLERVVELLPVDTISMPLFLDFLRTGAGSFQELRHALQARGRSAPPSVVNPPIEPEKWPSTDGWHFEPGVIWFRRRRYSSTPKPIAMLRLFLDPRRSSLGYADLRQVWGECDENASEETIRAHLAALREVLRTIASDINADPQIVANPLPYSCGGWKFLLPKS